MVVYFIVAIIAYLIGSISFSVIFGKIFGKIDVREKGSKNAGSTNVLRTVGKKAAILTLICDVLKGVVPILIALLIGTIAKFEKTEWLIQIAGIFSVIGHMFPIFFGFKGGKGVATSLGVILIANYQIGLICLLFAIIIMAFTRIVSIGSILAAVLFPVLTIFIHTNYITTGNYIIFGIILSVIVLFNHRENIKRLLAGKENKLSFKK